MDASKDAQKAKVKLAIEKIVPDTADPKLKKAQVQFVQLAFDHHQTLADIPLFPAAFYRDLYDKGLISKLSEFEHVVDGLFTSGLIKAFNGGYINSGKFSDLFLSRMNEIGTAQQTS